MWNQGNLFVIKVIKVVMAIIKVDLAPKSIDGAVQGAIIKLCRALTLLTTLMAGTPAYTTNFLKTT